MAESLTFFVPGKPRGQQRPRFVRKLGIAFTPNETRVAAADVRAAFVAAHPEHHLWTGPIFLRVVARYDVPASRPKWWRERVSTGCTPFVSRPDLDNVVKLVKDALTSVVWKDDSQVFQILAHKFYCLGNENPGTEITIEHCPELVPERETPKGLKA
jgi:Holliday junction resolvase RusA-like endonuclease